MSVNPNSVEWRVAYRLGCWAAVAIWYRRRGERDAACHYALGMQHATASAVRDVLERCGKAKRKAVGAVIREALRETLALRGKMWRAA